MDKEEVSMRNTASQTDIQSLNQRAVIVYTVPLLLRWPICFIHMGEKKTYCTAVACTRGLKLMGQKCTPWMNHIRPPPCRGNHFKVERLLNHSKTSKCPQWGVEHIPGTRTLVSSRRGSLQNPRCTHYSIPPLKWLEEMWHVEGRRLGSRSPSQPSY